MDYIMNSESTLQTVSLNHHRSAFAWRWVSSDSSSPLPFSPSVLAEYSQVWSPWRDHP